MIAGAVIACAISAVITFAAAWWLRQTAWQQVSLFFVLVGAALWSLSRPADERWWVLVVAPLVTVVAEAGRAAVDARRRSGTTLVEAAVWRAMAPAVALVAVVAALAALAVVAFVPVGTVPSGLLPAGLAAGVAGVLVLAWGLHRLGGRRAAVRRAGPALAAVVVAVVGGAVAVGLAAEARSSVLRGTPAEITAGGTTGTGPATATTVAEVVVPVPVGGGADLGRFTWLAALFLLVAGVIIVVLYGQRQQLLPPEDLVPDPVGRDRPDVLDGPLTPSRVVDRAATVAVVDEAIVRLRADAIPRTAVRQAYATVAQGLGRAELVRAQSETEGEYLERVLGRVGAGGQDLATLTALFSRARFSDDEVDESMRAAALAALERIRRSVSSDRAPDAAAEED